MDRSTLYSQEQGRTFDILSFEKDVQIAIGGLETSVAGQTTTVVSGLSAHASSPLALSVQLTKGYIYAQAAADTTSWGALPSDATLIQQQGFAAAQTVVLSTSGLSSGHNRWALIQAQFLQVDAVRGNDPTGGLLYYWNSANPDSPLEGPGNSGEIQPTVRQGVCSITVIYGAPAVTGAEVPPNPAANNVPLYLIDLTYGQTTIGGGQIIIAGPSAGPNVPSNYPGAPFLAGLLNAHHSGGAGQGPQIDLTTEVKNILPLANLPASSARTGGGLCTTYSYHGNPNGNVPGTTSVDGISPPDLCWDSAHDAVWICAVSGDAASAVWLQSGTLRRRTYYVAATGSDVVGDGTITNPWATLQHAIDSIGIFSSPAAVTINVAAGTYVVPAHSNFGSFSNTQISQWIINGAGPSTFIDASASNARGFSFSNCEVTVNDVAVLSDAEAFVSTIGGLITLNNIMLQGSNTGVSAYSGSQFDLIGNWVISGTFSNAIYQAGGGSLEFSNSSGSQPLDTQFGTTTVPQVLNSVNSGIATFYSGSVTWGGATPTGKRFNVARSAGIDTNGQSTSWIPGSIAGTTVSATYGWYV